MLLDRARRIVGAACVAFVLAFPGSAGAQQGSPQRQALLDQANALRSQCEVAQMFGRSAEAEGLVRRAIALVEKEFGSNHREVAFFREALARVYRAQGKLTEAAAENRAALGINPDAGPSLLLEIGEIALQQQRFEDAKIAFANSLKVVTSDTSYRQRAYRGLGSVEFHQGMWRDAADWWSRGAEETLATIRAGKIFRRQSLGATESAAEVSDDAAMAFYGFLRSAYRATQQDDALRASMTARAFEFAQWVTMSRAGEAIHQMAARYAAESAADPNVLRERQELSTRWRSLNERRVELRTSRAEADRDVAATTAEMNGIDARLAAIDRVLGDSLPDYIKVATPEARSLKEVQATLRNDEVVLFIVTVPMLSDMPGETYVWAVGRDRTEWLVSDLDETAIGDSVSALRCGTDASSWSGAGQATCERLLGKPRAPGSSLPFDTRRAYELYRRLLSASRLVDQSRNLLVVANGALTKLPLHLLVTREPSNTERLRDVGWLVRTKAIAMLPTVSSLVAFRSTALRSHATRAMIGFGNPALAGHPTATVSVAEVNAAADQARRITSCTLIGAGAGGGARDYAELIRNRDGQADVAQIMRYQPLPETAGELCAVADYLRPPQTDIFLAAKATETAIKELSRSGELEKYRVVYFATHGVMASRLRGVSEPGLLLTPPETASSADDGYLSSSEIAALKLDADWVVLSACNTAAGATETDEPLSGIAQAFFYAKARALLISHWAVDSSAAVRLTTVAFRYLAGSKQISRAEALRLAMVELIDADDGEFAHPGIWSPFGFAGDPAI